MTTVTQSPEWDANVSLDDMMSQAKFFLIVKGESTLVKIVHTESMLHGKRYYQYYGLGHDRFGVTYDSDGSIDADFIAHRMEQQRLELTSDRQTALQWIDDVMNCRN